MLLSQRKSDTVDLIRYQLLLDEKEKRQCEQSLAQFVKSSWHLIEPGTELVWNWHLDVLCAYLEAVASGKIKRLVINIPPGTMKSSIVAVAFPAWTWIADPGHRFLNITNEQGLALRDALKAKTILESEWFQDKWPLPFDKRQNEKILYRNTSQGFRQSLGINSNITGKRGDTLLLDDPNDATQAESVAHRTAVNQAYDLKISNRLNEPNIDNPNASAIVLISQRLHVNDLSGHVLAKKEIPWTNLVIPMEYEGKPTYDPEKDIGRPDLADPRTEEGELLFTFRFNRKTVNGMKEDLGSYGTSGQLQQRPSPKGGGIIRLNWFKRYDTMPIRRPEHTLRLSIDSANKDKEINDPSVCGAWLTTDAGHFLLEVWRDRVIYPDLKSKIISLLDHWKPNECIIEDKASGQQLIQDLKRETFHNIIANDPTGQGDKIVRISNESPAIEAGHVWLPKSAPWLHELETEIEQFPKGDHDDQIDMISQFLKRIRAPNEIFVG